MQVMYKWVNDRHKKPYKARNERAKDTPPVSPAKYKPELVLQRIDNRGYVANILEQFEKADSMMSPKRRKITDDTPEPKGLLFTQVESPKKGIIVSDSEVEEIRERSSPQAQSERGSCEYPLTQKDPILKAENPEIKLQQDNLPPSDDEQTSDDEQNDKLILAWYSGIEKPSTQAPVNNVPEVAKEIQAENSCASQRQESEVINPSGTVAKPRDPTAIPALSNEGKQDTVDVDVPYDIIGDSPTEAKDA